jgi:DNA-binding MarR family transcriptional regulator
LPPAHCHASCGVTIPIVRRQTLHMRNAKTKAAKSDNYESDLSEISGGSLDMTYLRGTIGYAIRRAQMAVFDDLQEAIGKYQISPTQFSVLSLVADNPGALQSTIAEALGVERPRIVPVIDQLEKRGLATRVRSATDGRARKIYLTAEGASLLETLKSRFAEHQRRVAARLNSGTDALLAELWRLAGDA